MAKRSLTVTSRTIIAASYDDETEELDVTFNTGRTYTHQGVPPNVADDLQTTHSPGSYYAAYIRGRYS